VAAAELVVLVVLVVVLVLLLRTASEKWTACPN
jgi:hypothetical protein